MKKGEKLATVLATLNVTTLNYALAENREGKWAALFTASNETDAQIGPFRMKSDWFETREEAEAKVSEVVVAMAEMGLRVIPLKPPS